MSPVNLARVEMGAVIMAGLLFYRPMAYFGTTMIILVGLTGICPLERFFSKVLGDKAERSYFERAFHK